MPSDYMRRIYANGAARGESEAILLLLRTGGFSSVDQAVAFIARSQKVTPDVFERVCVAWDLLDTDAEIGRLDESPLRDVPKP